MAERRTRIQVHLPRKSEAEVFPELKTDITFRPRFYKRQGSAPVFYFSVIDAFDNQELYMLYINSKTKSIHVEKMVEVTPACDLVKTSNKNESDDQTTQD